MFGDPSAWQNPPNLGHGCGFLVGDFESTCTCTCPTHTWVLMQVCKPVTGPTYFSLPLPLLFSFLSCTVTILGNFLLCKFTYLDKYNFKKYCGKIIVWNPPGIAWNPCGNLWNPHGIAWNPCGNVWNPLGNV